MTRTLTALYDSYDDALATVRELEAAGLDQAQISLVANNAQERAVTTRTVETVSEAGTGAGAGATVGALAGGAAGLLAGLGMLAIPGVGPVVAAGWLIATAAGAAGGAVVFGTAGGLVGAMIRHGVPEEEAHVYAEGLRRGGTLVTARVEEVDVPRVEAILRRSRQVDTQLRGQAYRDTGWTRFDENAPPYDGPAYTEIEIRRERHYKTAPPPPSDATDRVVEDRTLPRR
jgi:hypothetical protein